MLKSLSCRRKLGKHRFFLLMLLVTPYCLAVGDGLHNTEPCSRLGSGEYSSSMNTFSLLLALLTLNRGLLGEGQCTQNPRLIA
jgi:hypothetical protein